MKRHVVSDEVQRQFFGGSAIVTLPAESVAYPDGEHIGLMDTKRRENSLSDAMFVWIALPSDAFWVYYAFYVMF